MTRERLHIRRLVNLIRQPYQRTVISSFGVRTGKHFTWNGKRPVISNQGRIILGNDVRFRCELSPVRITCTKTGTIHIGDRAFINNGVQIYSSVGVSIGAGTLIADDCVILDSSFHAVHYDQQPISRAISIGKNVWLGLRAIVLPGVTIGDHSVIAAGSVVFEDVPPAQVWSGNPAQFQKAVRISEGFERH